MSIASELASLSADINNAESKIIEKGGTVAHSGTSFLATNIDTIPQGGETFIESLIGDGTNTLDTAHLPSGIYHGHRTDEQSSPYSIVGFYVLKQDNQMSFITKNTNGLYRNYVSSNGVLFTNASTQLFIGTYDIYHIKDLEY